MIMSDHLDTFERKVRYYRNRFFEKVLTVVLNTTMWFVLKCKSLTDTRALDRVKGQVEMLDRELVKEITTRKKLQAASLTKQGSGTRVPSSRAAAAATSGSTSARKPISTRDEPGEPAPKRTIGGSRSSANLNLNGMPK